MFAVLRSGREYCQPARVQQDRRGLMILRNTRRLPGQDGIGEFYIITVAHVHGNVCSTGIRSDNIGITEAPLDDFYSDGFEGV